MWKRGRAYGQDLRERIFAAADAGEAGAAIAARLLVSASHVSKVLARRLRTGETAARPQRCHVPLKLAAHHDAIGRRVAECPDATLGELRTWLREALGVEASTTLVWETLNRLKLTLKKKTTRAAERDRPDVAKSRRRWRRRRRELNPRKLVFIDETSTRTNMFRPRGRSRRGRRLVATMPHGERRTSTFVAALRHDRLAAPFVIDGAVDGETFRTYAREVLAPTLSRGDVVAMDNLGSHKVAGVREAIEAAGATCLYIPPYSPDLNPIEMVFAKIKSILKRKALRTVEALWRELGEVTKCVSPAECRNYMRHAGYF